MKQLIGSEKQIKWAANIIAEKVAYINKQVDGSLSDEEKEKNEKLLKALVNMVEHINDAKFWIDNRDSSIPLMMGIVRGNPDKFKKYWELGGQNE